MTDDPDQPAVDDGARVPERERVRGQAIVQSVLVASLVGAIILMIAMGAFWTTF